MSVERESARFNWRPWVAVTAALLAGGAAHRLAAACLRPLLDRKIELPVPLGRFPTSIAGWTGEDRPLTPEVARIAGNDDYLNRLYQGSGGRERVALYIAYCGRPRNMLGHRPQVCYVAHGWDHLETREDRLELPGGRTIPCLIHRFRPPRQETGATVVLNYYVLNGVPTNDERRFAGVGWRRPNLAGDPAFYVAQVQLSSGSEAAVRALATATAERILDFLPGPDGRVREAEVHKPGTPGREDVPGRPDV